MNLRGLVVIQRLVVKTRGVSISWDVPVGNQVTGQAAAGVMEGLLDGSGVSREAPAPFCEGPGVQLLRPTHRSVY